MKRVVEDWIEHLFFKYLEMENLKKAPRTGAGKTDITLFRFI
jgi:hypothetical protein